GIACRDEQALPVSISERDVGRADLALRLAAVDGQLEKAEQRAGGRGDAHDAGAGAARGVKVAELVRLHAVADSAAFGEQRALAERAVRLDLVAHDPLPGREIKVALVRRERDAVRNTAERLRVEHEARLAVLDEPDAVRHLLVGAVAGIPEAEIVVGKVNAVVTAHGDVVRAAEALSVRAVREHGA